MIKDNTILSSFDERPTLLEWLKKVEQVQGEAVKQVAIENGNLVVTFVSGKTEIVGPVGGENPYADIILINRATNTTEIVNNGKVDRNLVVTGQAAVGGLSVAGVPIDDKISSAINSAITSTLEANY